jgi:hypothetical protein
MSEMTGESPTMLRAMGPTAGGFGIELEGGPIPAIAEYLANMLGMQGDAPSNYVSMEVNRADVGAMVLTLQRCSGKTPHQLRKDAEDRAALLKASLSDFMENPAFQVAIGGNPTAVDAMMARARHALTLSKGSDV